MITAIILNYNGERTILKSIKSVGMADEIIVIDDASTDNSVNMIKSNFPEVKIIQNKTQGWVAKCRNQGVGISKGDVILFMDSDIYLKEGFESMVGDIKKWDMVSPSVYFENGEVMYPRGMELVNTACLMINKDVVKNISFDENYKFYFEDIDFFIRARLRGFTSKCSDALAIHCLKSEVTNHELKYYFRVRNLIYLFFKFKRFNLKRCEYDNIGIKLIKMFFLSLANYSWRKRFEKHTYKEKITKRSRIYLSYLFAKAVLDALLLRKKISKQNL